MVERVTAGLGVFALIARRIHIPGNTVKFELIVNLVVKKNSFGIAALNGGVEPGDAKFLIENDQHTSRPLFNRCWDQIPEHYVNSVARYGRGRRGGLR